MRKTGSLYRWGPIALALLLSILLFTFNLPKKIRTWPEMCSDGIVFTESEVRDISQGDHYGIMTQGPGLHLPAGTYRLKWIIDCDGINTVRLTSANNARFEQDNFPVYPDQTNSDIHFTLYDAAESFEILVDFSDGNSIHIYDFRMYSGQYRDHQFTFTVLAIVFCLFWLMHCNGTHPDPSILLIAAAVIYASVPSFRDNYSELYDTVFHVNRIWNLADGLASGQFPVRVGGYSYNGYGAITSVLYPDFFLYPFALMLLAGFSTNYVMQLILISINVVSAITMYCCAKRIFEDHWIAVASSILYVLAIYRITDSYVRCALGEAIAMAFLPVFLSGMWDTFFGDCKRWPILALGASALLLSHLITTFMCAIFMLCAFLVYLRHLIREKRLLSLCLAGIFALGLCLFQLLPIAQLLQAGINARSIRGTITNYMISPAQLFLWGEGDMPVDPFDSTLPGQPIEPGMILNIGAILALYAVLKKREIKGESRSAIRLVLWGIIGAFSTTTLFPWGHVGVLTHGITDYIQFAWRFMMFPTIFFSLAGAYGYLQLIESKEKATALILIIAIVMVLPTISKQTRFNDVISYGEIPTPNMHHTEYTLPGTMVGDTTDRTPHPSEGIEISEFTKHGTNITCCVEAQTDGTISFPLFGFPGYRAKVNNIELSWSLSENNRLTVDVPAGSGYLQIFYRESILWRISELVSLLCLVLLFIRHLKRKKSPSTP